MRLTALALFGSLALAAAPANAGPAIVKAVTPTGSNVTTVSGGCGPAFYRDPWGYCVPNNYYYGYGYAGAYVPGWYGYPYARTYYLPHWRHW